MSKGTQTSPAGLTYGPDALERPVPRGPPCGTRSEERLLGRLPAGSLPGDPERPNWNNRLPYLPSTCATGDPGNLRRARSREPLPWPEPVRLARPPRDHQQVLTSLRGRTVHVGSENFLTHNLPVAKTVVGGAVIGREHLIIWLAILVSENNRSARFALI